VRVKKLYVILVAVGVVMGLLFSTQLRLVKNMDVAPPYDRAYLLATQVAEVREERDAMQKEMDELRARLDKSLARPQLADLKSELDTYRIRAGLVDMKGSGVEVTLNDSPVQIQPGENPNLFVLHDEDVLKILNELNAAGAEALAINNQRVIATTEVRCIGPTILINKNQRLTPPFIITAIGNPDILEGSLKMKGGVIESLQFWGIMVSVKKVPELTIPAFSGGLRFDYARPAQ
jgi:uncharacterized protein YlxW (UPF0749 family)